MTDHDVVQKIPTQGGPVYSVSLDLSAALAQPSICPSCGAVGLTSQVRDVELVFSCPACSGSWRVEGARLVRDAANKQVPAQREP